MTTFENALDGPTRAVPQVRRRARGLRFPVLPSGALLAQVGGGVGATAGLYHVVGWGITLIVVGVVTAVLGALREVGKV